MYFENPLNQPDLRLTLATGVEGRKGDAKAAAARWNMRTFCRVWVFFGLRQLGRTQDRHFMSAGHDFNSWCPSVCVLL